MQREETPVLEVRNVAVTYRSPEREIGVLKNVQFSVGQGETVAVRGENGSGKTSLLNLIAGIQKPDEGSIILDGTTRRKPNIGFVFQNYGATLLPWLTAAENICLPLSIEGVSQAVSRKKLENVLERLKFEQFPLQVFPHQLSGGQRQKVAIARSLIRDPEILLLDEPFSNLDFQTSVDVQQFIQNVQSQNKTSMVLVSHDIDHSLLLADRVLVLSGHPSTVTKEFRVDLDRPSNVDALFSAELETLRNEILEYEYAAFQDRRPRVERTSSSE